MVYNIRLITPILTILIFSNLNCVCSGLFSNYQQQSTCLTCLPGFRRDEFYLQNIIFPCAYIGIDRYKYHCCLVRQHHLYDVINFECLILQSHLKTVRLPLRCDPTIGTDRSAVTKVLSSIFFEFHEPISFLFVSVFFKYITLWNLFLWIGYL
jgi:hypothetical protein